MNKHHIIASATVAAAMLLTGCATTNHQAAYSTYQPDEVRLNVNVQDLQCIGQTEISVTEDVYFGIFRSTREVNGKKYDSWNKKTARLNGATWGHKVHGFEKAAPKVAEQFPDADLYQVVRQTKKVERMFGMNTYTRTAIVKAYKVK